MNKSFYRLMFFAAVVLTLSGAAQAQVATNPPYTLEQTVIAGGGGKSTDAGNVFTLEGTIGQPITDRSTGAPFTVRSGFFSAAPSPLAPTAATVMVSGKVQQTNGRGIRNVRISMTDASGTVRTAVSGAFGQFQFRDVAVGETYIFTAKGKRFSFEEPTQALSVNEEVVSLSFVALPKP